ncbi:MULTISPECIES: hypothetical protein [Burkholderia]|uniref:hypothetical protein n=1 Tax=Burkholderia TaxID=32008 RepID=UPI0003EC7D3D|nr:MULTISPECIES: hypothetical protein [Burkholderia]AHI64547.1 hypothetical protein BTL_683 [Burkholderia thailandensis H0587]AOJ49727.1 hypothetical protein AQ475_02000 [Burkholderia thailandensis]AVR25105.1 hypothetical protein A8H32_08240 [Burkholderia thailandensis]MBU9424768.1 hypothetical protein [Burkholderia gladioli]MDN8061829.1 hypothetical protein [Burkholderia gladioli]
MSAPDTTKLGEQTAIDLEFARATQKTAEIQHYWTLIEHQHERYALAQEHCVDMDRKQAARGMMAAAAIFEIDGRRMPSRLKKAADVIKIAVFLLDPKAPA